MSTEPITQVQRDRLQSSRNLLLELHKFLLDRERGLYEQANGPIASPNEYLNLVLNHSQFEWLRLMSGMIVQIDESLSRRSTADATIAESLIAEVKQLLIRDEDGNHYQRKYWQALEDSADVIITHVKLERVLAR